MARIAFITSIDQARVDERITCLRERGIDAVHFPNPDAFFKSIGQQEPFDLILSAFEFRGGPLSCSAYARKLLAAEGIRETPILLYSSSYREMVYCQNHDGKHDYIENNEWGDELYFNRLRFLKIDAWSTEGFGNRIVPVVEKMLRDFSSTPAPAARPRPHRGQSRRLDAQ